MIRQRLQTAPEKTSGVRSRAVTDGKGKTDEKAEAVHTETGLPLFGIRGRRPNESSFAIIKT